MIIYYLYIVLIGIVSFLSREIKSRTQRKKIIAFIFWLGLFLIMALRAETVGNDIIRYIESYKNIAYIDPWQTSTEFGYVYFLKILKFFHVGPQGYIVVTSFFISSLFSWFIYKYSENIGFSFLLHLTIGLFAMTLSGIRQSMAISIIMIAIYFAINRKFIKFLICVSFASLFHQSAIVFFPAYLLFGNIKNNSKVVYMFILILLLVIVGNEWVFSFFSYISPKKYVDSYLLIDDRQGMNILPVLFRISLLLLILIFWRLQNFKISDMPKLDVSFSAMAFVSVIFTVLSLNLSVFNRLSDYYFSSLIILFPNTLRNFRDRNIKFIFQTILIILSILYFTISTTDGILKIDNYKFFWSK